MYGRSAMRDATGRIIVEALALPPEEREEIVRTLIASLEPDLGLEPEIYAEVLRRLDEVRSGTAEMIPGAEAMQEIDRAATARKRPGAPRHFSAALRRPRTKG
jgi:putative addiction module component (TIGR02574 family)